MGALSQYLERAGIATAGISLIREQTEKINPPRALWVPFELGRPLGPPDDPAFQRRVLAAALGLLEADAGPVLAEFPDDAPPARDDESEGWACPVPLRHAAPAAATGPAAALLAEIELVRPWYDLARQRRGRTTVGASGLDMAAAAELVAGFAAAPDAGTLPDGRPAAAQVKLAMEDLRAFYGESASAGPSRGSSREIADWFWGETEAGRTFLRLRDACRDHADPAIRRLGAGLTVPALQGHRSL